MNRALISWIFWAAFIATTLLPTAVCQAQNATVTVEAEIPRQRAYVGDVLPYQVTVRGVDPDDLPEIEFPPTVRAEFSNSGQRTFVSSTIIGGRRQSTSVISYTYNYRVTFMEPGMVTIPPAIVRVGNAQYESNPVTVEALYPVFASEDEIVVDLPRTKLYTNESVPADITWWIGNRNTSNFTFNSSSFPDSIRVTPVNSGFRGSQQFTLDIAGQQVLGVLDETVHNGTRRIRMRFKLMLTPSESGTYTLGPVRVVFERTESNRRYRAYVESKPVELVVLPVPDEGQPAGYAGAIGTYSLMTSASNQSVNVGDPIELTLRIQGNEPMLGIGDGPDLDADPAFKDRFKIASEGWREDLPRAESMRVYRTTIRALDDTITEIPAVQLPAFDPESESYRVFRSDPIPIDVRAVHEVTIADAIGSLTPATESANENQQSKIHSSGSALWAHAPVESMMTRDGFDLWNHIQSPVWIGTMALGPMSALFALVGIRCRRNRSDISWALRKAWAKAKHLESKGQTAEAIRVYLGAAAGCDQQAFSSNDLVSLGLEESLHDEVRNILQFDERNEFSSTPEHTTPPTTSDVLRRLRQAVESSPRVQFGRAS